MADDSKKKKPGLMVTGVCRLSYANVWEPKSVKDGEPKYSVSVIIPKTDTTTLADINTAIQEAYESGKGLLQGKNKTAPPLSSVKTPLRDGDEDRPGDEAYKDAFFVNANSKTAPGIVDKKRQPILDQDEVYSGMYARVQLAFYAFNVDTQKGIACGLQHIQKVRDGEPLSGRMSAEDAFDDGFEDEEGFLD